MYLQPGGCIAGRLLRPVAQFMMKNGNVHGILDNRSEAIYSTPSRLTAYLPTQAPAKPVDDTLNVRRTHYISRKGRFLCVYAVSSGKHAKRIFNVDMLLPHHRQSFLDVRRLAAEGYPIKRDTSPPKHKNLLRVLHSHCPAGKGRHGTPGRRGENRTGGAPPDQQK